MCCCIFIAVSKLLYRRHVSSKYHQVPGRCSDVTYSNQSLIVSKTTCRYICDMDQFVKPCLGFTYYNIPHSEQLQGTTTSKCEFLSSTCTPNMTYSDPLTSAFTYLRCNNTKASGYKLECLWPKTFGSVSKNSYNHRIDVTCHTQKRKLSAHTKHDIDVLMRLYISNSYDYYYYCYNCSAYYGLNSSTQQQINKYNNNY